MTKEIIQSYAVAALNELIEINALILPDHLSKETVLDQIRNEIHNMHNSFTVDKIQEKANKLLGE